MIKKLYIGLYIYIYIYIYTILQYYTVKCLAVEKGISFVNYNSF